jgi:uncharacterized membrane protein YeiH
MTEALKYFLWMYLRAAVWIALTASLIYFLTRNSKVTRAFVLAHMAALGFGALADYALIHYAPESWLQLSILQWVFTAPIVIFTVISLWICSWEKAVHASDVFMTLSAVAAWGFLVAYGWQSMWQCHVLGAWFVSAAAGSVDLCVRFGPEKVRGRPYIYRFLGYAMSVITVYLLLPRTEL